jgi:hypothetical protein
MRSAFAPHMHDHQRSALIVLAFGDVAPAQVLGLGRMRTRVSHDQQEGEGHGGALSVQVPCRTLA